MLSSQVTVNGTKMPAVRYIYDDLGKLSGKTVGSDCSLSETFSSDMTGKITGITLAAEDTVMSIRYGYESPVSSVAIPSFCGRISEINICHGNVATETGYTVRYDHLGRVRGAYPTTGERIANFI